MNNLSIDYMTANDGCRIRCGYRLTQRRVCLGTFVVLSGRSEFLEKYDETIGELVGRGYDVHSFDWRGQGGSTRMLANRLKGYVRTYDDYLADLSQFMKTVVAPAAKPPYYMLAHSMGAHIGLRYLHDDGIIFDRAVLTAPMIDLAMPNMLKHLLKRYTCLMIKLGMGQHYTPGSRDDAPEKHIFEKNRLTGDRNRFERMKQMLRKSPDLALGGVTYRWLLETLRSIYILSESGFAARIKTPVLMVSAEKDAIVSNNSQKRICGQLQKGKLITLRGALHEILIERDAVRSMFWDEFDDFLNDA